MIRTTISTLLFASLLLPSAVRADAGGTDEAALDATAEAGPAEEAEGGVSALDEFKRRHEIVMTLVKSNVPENILAAEVDTLLDYEWIALQSLGGKSRADRRCEPRCAEFEALLTRLIRENYLKRIAQSDNGSVEYVGEERRARATKVTTRVKFTKDGTQQTIEVAYVMHVVNGKWFVRDIITESVSLAKNYRYEFNKILRDEGIDGLVARLETKLADLAKTE
ncbi:MAG: ABC transporter substrate-binding protein [Myxococcales bacterium]|nr:ABC transporter substrate-binding protein [Myxococcales bacterium]